MSVVSKWLKERAIPKLRREAEKKAQEFIAKKLGANPEQAWQEIVSTAKGIRIDLKAGNVDKAMEEVSRLLVLLGVK